jgi:hypothetical protein
MSAIGLACLPPVKAQAFHGGSLDGRRSAAERGLPASGKEILLLEVWRIVGGMDVIGLTCLRRIEVASSRNPRSTLVIRRAGDEPMRSKRGRRSQVLTIQQTAACDADGELL